MNIFGMARMIRFIYSKLQNNFWPLIIVILFGILAGRYLLFQSGYFNMHDDLQMMRQLEMEKCLLDGQIPCRWVPDMGYGFGFPLFNYYPPLPYLIGEIFRLVGLSFITTVKLTFALSFIASGVAMYFLSKEFFGKMGGVISAIFYIWAPYHSVDVYVRGAMNEAWALVFFPTILLFSYKLLVASPKPEKAKAGKIVLLALSWTGLLLSHNLMVLIFTPIFAVWCLLWIIRSRNFPFIIYHLSLSGIIALGLSAFFTLPAVLEQKYVQVNTLVAGYYEYIAHFVSLNQLLISRFWGYGPSVWETNDGMPFQVGHIHWILSLLIIVLFIIRYFKTKKFDNLLLVTCYLFLVGWFVAFMAHSRSTPIWQAFPFLKFVQFPWRFLTLVTLSFSFIAGSIVILMRSFDKLRMTATSFLIILLVAVNWNYFKPEHGRLGPLTDQEKFTGAAWELQQTAGIYDYLPKDAKEAPKEPRRKLAEVVEGSGIIANEEVGTDWANFTVLGSSEKTIVRINIMKFPEWVATVGPNDKNLFVPEDEKWGRMYLKPGGEFENPIVYLKLENTPVRRISNVISLVAWVGLISFPIWRKKFSS